MVEAQEIAALSFETALSELEGIVTELETGQAELDRSIQVYERGAALKAHCERKLREAQLRIETILIGAEGAPTGRRSRRVFMSSVRQSLTSQVGWVGEPACPNDRSRERRSGPDPDLRAWSGVATDRSHAVCGARPG